MVTDISSVQFSPTHPKGMQRKSRVGVRVPVELGSLGSHLSHLLLILQSSLSLISYSSSSHFSLIYSSCSHLALISYSSPCHLRSFLVVDDVITI